MVRIFRAVFGEKSYNIEEVKGGGRFDSERTVQDLVEKNLDVIFPGHIVVSDEFRLEGKIIDTVAFNTKTRSFVIIEYKNVSPKGVLEQTGRYLTLLNQRQADFLLAYNETNTPQLKKTDIAWNESKMVVIAPSFTSDQLNMASMLNVPVELYQITRYENGIITIESVATHKPQVVKNTSTKQRDVEHLTKNISDTGQGLYTDLVAALKENFPSVETKERKYYVSLLSNGKSICTVRKGQKSLSLYYKSEHLEVPKEDYSFVVGLVEGSKKTGAGVLGNYRSTIKSSQDIARAIPYVKAIHTIKVKGASVPTTQRKWSSSQYTEKEHLDRGGSNDTKALYVKFKNTLRRSIPNAESRVTKSYINWMSRGKSICTVQVVKKSLNVCYNIDRLDVAKDDRDFVVYLVRNGKPIGKVGLGVFQSKIRDNEGIARAIPYVEEVYKTKVERYIK